MEIEKINIGDLAQLRKLRPEGWPDIVPEFKYYIKSDHCYSIKVNDDNNIIGTGALINYEDSAWIAHVIVDTNYRRRGIGSKIMFDLMEKFEILKAETCFLIATEAGIPLYKEFGFKELSEYVFFQREKPWKDNLPDAHIFPIGIVYHDAIFELDRLISGEDRRILFKEFLDSGFAYMIDNKLSGFYLPELREGPIIAENDNAGIALMKLKYAHIGNAVLPAENLSGIQYLKQNGFVKTKKRGLRMYYGKEVKWKPECIFSRIGGNFG